MGNLFLKHNNMSNIDAVIKKCVDDIWAEYDKDNSGALDKEETKAFVKKTLCDMEGSDGGDFSEEDFDACFKGFDKDNSGTIEKDEIMKGAATEDSLTNSRGY